MRYSKLLFFLVFLVGCGESERFASYDNNDEVKGFFQTRNKEVLVNLQEMKVELSKKIAEPEDSDKIEDLERDQLNNERRLKSPEFFTYAAMEDLPKNLIWKEGMDQPEIGSPLAKRWNLQHLLTKSSVSPTIRSIGKTPITDSFTLGQY